MMKRVEVCIRTKSKCRDGKAVVVKNGDGMNNDGKNETSQLESCHPKVFYRP